MMKPTHISVLIRDREEGEEEKSWSLFRDKDSTKEGKLMPPLVVISS